MLFSVALSKTIIEGVNGPINQRRGRKGSDRASFDYVTMSSHLRILSDNRQRLIKISSHSDQLTRIFLTPCSGPEQTLFCYHPAIFGVYNLRSRTLADRLLNAWRIVCVSA